MSPSPLSSKPCTKGGTWSRRWIAVALAVALVGFVGSAFAKTAKPIANAKPVAARSVDDASAQTTTLSETRAPGSPNAPSNDDCSGAVVIPDGPYPVLTAPVNAIDSTPDGSDDSGLTAACNSAGVDRTVWYKFTPSVSTAYTFTTCPAQGATGNTVLDTVIALFSSSDGTCGGILTSVACNDTASPACATPGDMSTMTALLTAGQTYYAVAGHWLPDGNFAAGNSTYVFSVARSNAPANDTCAGAVNLPLNRLITGTTTASNNDYHTPATAACFAGLAGTQTPTTSPGRDVTFTFTAPSAGNYSIRYFDAFGVGDLVGDDMVLYASDSCPAGGGVVNCIQGSNHTPGRGGNTISGPSSNTGEEITCVPLAAGQQIYVFLDSATTGSVSTPGVYGMEVTPCTREVEPNDTLATATP